MEERKQIYLHFKHDIDVIQNNQHYFLYVPCVYIPWNPSHLHMNLAVYILADDPSHHFSENILTI